MGFVILGRTALDVDGDPVPLGVAKQRGMLAALLYHAGEAVRAESLVELLWPGKRPEDCRKNLHIMVSRIRHVLKEAGFSRVLVRVPSVSGYRLEIDPLLIDFHRFRKMVDEAHAEARRESYEPAVQLLVKALGLWGDEPIADLHGPRAEHLRRHMNDSFLDAQRKLIDCELRLGRYQSALFRVDRVLPAHDLDETLARQRVTALCAVGRVDEARAYRAAFRKRYRAAVGVEPDIELPARPGQPHQAREAAGTSRRLAGTAQLGPRQLPNDITYFTGQEELLARLDELADPAGRPANIVVISGMPGAGKSTLVTHWAHRWRHRFPDGQLVLDANGYGPTPPVDPNEALRRFLRAFDVPAERIPPHRDERRDLLNRILAGRGVLIVLDNVKDCDQVRPLLTTSETCVTVITSRTRLVGLSVREGVPTLTVHPLPEDGCLALLARVIGGSRPAAEPEPMRALARLSGGLPLAARIIGEQVAQRSRARLVDLVEELGERRLLREQAGDDGGADGQMGLWAIFGWSYEALPPTSALLYRLLGLFPGRSFTPEAVAALVGIDAGTAERLLDGLAEAHLVNHDTPRRYRMHDLLRRYAANRAGSQEPEEQRRQATRRLLDWYLLTMAGAVAVVSPQTLPLPDLPAPDDVAPLRFPGDAEALRWCEAERENLMTLARWAADNGFCRHAWQIPGVSYEIFDRYGPQHEVAETLRVALTAAEADRHDLGRIGVLINLGAAYFTRHDYPRAAEAFGTARELAAPIGATAAELIAAHNLATVYLRRGDPAEAVPIYEHVLHQRRLLGNRVGVAATLHRLGDARRALKDYSAAQQRYSEALRIREEIGSLRGQGATHTELASLHLETGRWDLAVGHGHRALEIHERTRDEPALCDTLVVLAEVWCERGDGAQAARYARRAAEVSGEIADPSRRCRALTVLAHALSDSGDRVTAAAVREQALVLLDEVTEPDLTSLRGRLDRLREPLVRPREGRTTG